MSEWPKTFLEKWSHVFEAEPGCFPDWGFGTLWGVKFGEPCETIPKFVGAGHWLVLLRYYDHGKVAQEDVAREIIEFAQDVGTGLGLGAVLIKEMGPRSVRFQDGTTETFSYPVLYLNGCSFDHNYHPETYLIDGDKMVKRDWLACVMEWREVDG